MSKWDKLLQRVCSLSADVRFEELKKILEDYGYSILFVFADKIRYSVFIKIAH